MTDPSPDDKLLPGARNGRIGVYDRPASKRWMFVVAAVIISLLISVGLYYLFWAPEDTRQSRAQPPPPRITAFASPPAADCAHATATLSLPSDDCLRVTAFG